ncbi:hypothetical protein MKD41_06420 [Lutibacter sp. A64]|uniref:hypothetical protein n=1 Tax=Lutibacter sp. A64 TaxID=2918526 RepID=UPI001F051E7C|nr:hypothetical protein [Lutibacter sp. A64]UMB55106.1 hypothetical protein MKD41_06420 [Lutibacter sp. A64]
MNPLKKYLFLGLIITLIFFAACTSDAKDDELIEEVTVEKIAITSFDMLSKKHSFSVIAANIQAVDSLVICLFPSVVEYSKINPTITFEGANIEYRINNGIFNTYTTNVGAFIDFSYPNTVDFKVTNSDGSDSKIYRIIVDTEQPILFSNSEISIPDLPINTNYNGLEIDTWKNVGNYPIRLTLRTTEFKDVVMPETAGSNIFSTTLTKESDMIYPNEEGEINVFTSNASVTGLYSTTALFNLYFNENLGYIVYDDVSTSKYVKNIGYKQAELKLKGNLID